MTETGINMKASLVWMSSGQVIVRTGFNSPLQNTTPLEAAQPLPRHKLEPSCSKAHYQPEDPVREHHLLTPNGKNSKHIFF